jgi:hypothetical protein
MTPDDRLVVATNLAGTGVTLANDTAILAERGGQLAVVAREGDPAPGAGGAAFSSDVYFARFNAEGRAAMTLPVAGSGVTTDNDTGIWSEASGPLRLVAREGDPAPGAGDAARFAYFATPQLNSSGQTLFYAGVSDPGSTTYGSLWLDDAGALTMLAKKGQFAPGFGPNAYFGVLYYDDSLGINNAGDILFEARVYGTGLPASPDAVYVMEDGVPKLFMSEWQMFDGQLVGGLSVVGLNELRQALLFVTFVGPDGVVFTPDDTHGYYLVTIPEPATLLLLGGAGAALLMRRRSHPCAP